MILPPPSSTLFPYTTLFRSPYWLAVRLSQVLAMPYTQTPSRVKVSSAKITRCRVRRSSLTEATQRRYIRPIKLRKTPRLATAGINSQAGCTGLPAPDRLLNQAIDASSTARLANSRISRYFRLVFGRGAGVCSMVWLWVSDGGMSDGYGNRKQ